jgi:1,4-dihydroxy-2-naphthoyl-CoA hydrolase
VQRVAKLQTPRAPALRGQRRSNRVDACFDEYGHGKKLNNRCDAVSFFAMHDQLRTRATRNLADTLGIELVELTKERVVATMPVDERTRQPFGILHGGASVALAETVASLAATMNVDLDRSYVVGIEINANHIRAKKEGRVTGTATPVHVGRSTQVWSVQIVDEQHRVICVSRCTLAVVPKEPA